MAGLGDGDVAETGGERVWIDGGVGLDVVDVPEFTRWVVVVETR